MAGDDYPRSLVEFDQRFATEEPCLAYVSTLRWPSGFVCPRCRGQRGWQKSRGLLTCSACAHESSATAGTIFHKTRKPLPIWFKAMWWVTSQKYGASALGLQRVLGLGSYQTAWAWLHKLRRAMVRPGRDRLTGSVEVDETYVGGLEEGVHGRELEGKALVAIAAEVRDRGIGRIRMQHVEDASAASLMPFVSGVLEPGTLVLTDSWSAYAGLRDAGYRHRVRNMRRSTKEAHELMPRVHRAAALLKRWLLGTHQGAVSKKHLAYYLDEFTFRFNRRTSTY